MNSIFDEGVLQRAEALVDQFKELGIMLVTAESCTAGLIAGAVTDVAGSSAVLDRGFITYSNEAKVDMLDVSPTDIERAGAVSEPVASAMAEGALAHSNADIAVSVTGIAGPGGGTDLKPVGLVWFGCAVKGRSTLATSHKFEDHGRSYIRQQTVLFALELAIAAAAELHGDE
ncbi:MAG: CinA family protein [Pseudomonadota bacterium]